MIAQYLLKCSQKAVALRSNLEYGNDYDNNVSGAIALAEFLAESSRIIRLDLRNNDIQFGGLMALSLAFKINFSLLRLDVDKPQSKETVRKFDLGIEES